MFEITELPLWNVIEGNLEFTQQELYRLAEIIAENIIERIVFDQIDANEDPLPINSERWLRRKRLEGRDQRSLIYKERITNINFWEIKVEDYGLMSVQLEPAMKEIHRELIELSHETGKPYHLFFGYNEHDYSIIHEAAWLMMQEKLRRYR